jgi:hypothetical protein
MRSPLLWPSVSTPESERHAIQWLNAHLSALTSSLDRWEAALKLYEFAKSPVPGVPGAISRQWRFIAATECGFELHHLKKHIEKIRGVSLKKCPSILPFVDLVKVRSAAKRFHEFFPGADSLRDAIAHSAEFDAHPEEHAPEGSFALSGFSEEDRYSVPFRGKLYYVDLTSKTLEQMRAVVVEFFAGFEPAARSLEAQGHIE